MQSSNQSLIRNVSSPMRMQQRLTGIYRFHEYRNNPQGTVVFVLDFDRSINK